MQPLISRRGFLAAVTTAVVATSAHSDIEASLKVRAKKHGLVYGCAVRSGELNDSAFIRAVSLECNILVPEYELKRHVLEPSPNLFDFSGADKIATFAADNLMKMRGHTLIWHASNPPWLMAALKEKPSERIMTDYITKVAGSYRDRMHSWDVVNEAIEPADGHPDGLRIKSPWYHAFGPSYIETAFYAAREADPNALLFYNEYGIESAAAWNEPRRIALLKLCERLVTKGVPLDAVGIQGHLKAFRENFNEKIFAKLIEEIRSLGLKIMITEFDVADIGGPSDIAKRDAEVASLSRRFLDVVLDCPATLGVLTWGLSDRYSWLSDPKWGKAYAWPDGQLSRGLPLDANLRRKAMWHAMAEAFSDRR